MSSPPVFRCVTSDAFRLKVLIELLSNNLKTGCFEVTSDGIALRMFDNPRKTMVDLALNADCFSLYRFNSHTQFCMGLGLRVFHDMMCNIQKKDSLELFVNADEAEIGVKRIPKEKTSVTTSMITIQKIQTVDIDVPRGYGSPFVVPSTAFKKMCSELKQINGKTVRVTATADRIDFTVGVDRILRRTVSFNRDGESGMNTEHGCATQADIIYTAEFMTDQFKRIMKIAGLGTVIQIFPGNDPTAKNHGELPLCLRTSVGILGDLSLYIKSFAMTEQEESTVPVYTAQPSTGSDDSDSSDLDE